MRVNKDKGYRLIGDQRLRTGTRRVSKHIGKTNGSGKITPSHERTLGLYC